MVLDGHRRPISELYVDDAVLYANLAQDRDFRSEVEALRAAAGAGTGDRPLRVVDLFAGPAYHAIAFQGCGDEAFALDASPSMARVAREAGLQADRYRCMTLPAGAAALPDECDLLFAGRYSAGYLNAQDLVDLLRRVRRHLSSHGSIVLELHQAGMIRRQFADLAIRERLVCLPDGRHGSCRWPASIHWLDGSNTVAMAVDILDGDGAPIRRYLSVEHMHLSDDVARGAELAGFVRCDAHSALFARVFPQSEILHLRCADV